MAPPNYYIEKYIQDNQELLKDVDIKELRCPITNNIMIDPVAISSFRTFERNAIEKYLEDNDVCPLTKMKIKNKNVMENQNMKEKCDNFLKPITEAYISEHWPYNNRNDVCRSCGINNISYISIYATKQRVSLCDQCASNLIRIKGDGCDYNEFITSYPSDTIHSRNDLSKTEKIELLNGIVKELTSDRNTNDLILDLQKMTREDCKNDKAILKMFDDHCQFFTYEQAMKVIQELNNKFNISLEYIAEINKGFDPNNFTYEYIFSSDNLDEFDLVKAKKISKRHSMLQFKILARVLDTWNSSLEELGKNVYAFNITRLRSYYPVEKLTCVDYLCKRDNNITLILLINEVLRYHDYNELHITARNIVRYIERYRNTPLHYLYIKEDNMYNDLCYNVIVKNYNEYLEKEISNSLSLLKLLFKSNE